MRDISMVGRTALAVLTGTVIAVHPAAPAAGVPIEADRPQVSATHAANANEEPQLQVDAVTVSRSDVAVSGVETVPVTVTVRGRWTGEVGDTWPIMAHLTRVQGRRPNDTAPTDRLVTLRPVPGSDRRVYRGTTAIPSTMNGTFQVTTILPDGDPFNAVPPVRTISVDGPRLRVRGTRIPWIAGITTEPSPVPIRARAYTVTGLVLDTATRRGLDQAVTVMTGTDSVCVEGGPTQAVRAAPGSGRWRVTRHGADLLWTHCAALLPSPLADLNEAIAIRGHGVRKQTWISATPAVPQVRAGRSTPVTGSVGGGLEGVQVQLERRRAGAWHVVGTARVRASGRYALTATPPTRGVHRYRVVMPEYYDWVSVASPSFVVRAG